MTIILPIRDTKVLPIFTFANLPTTNLYNGKMVELSDYNGAFVQWDDTLKKWGLSDHTAAQIYHLAPVIPLVITGNGVENQIFSKKIDKTLLETNDTIIPTVLCYRNAATAASTFFFRIGEKNSSLDLLAYSFVMGLNTNGVSPSIRIAWVNNTQFRIVIPNVAPVVLTLPIGITTDNSDMYVTCGYLGAADSLSVSEIIVNLG